MMSGLARRLPVCLAVLLAALPLAGCLVVNNVDETTTGKGAAVPRETVAQVEPGKTTQAQLLALLGDPSETRNAGQGETLYVWDYGKTVSRQSNIFLLLHDQQNKTTRQRVQALVKDGIVQRIWTDSSDN